MTPVRLKWLIRIALAALLYVFCGSLLSGASFTGSLLRAVLTVVPVASVVWYLLPRLNRWFNALNTKKADASNADASHSGFNVDVKIDDEMPPFTPFAPPTIESTQRVINQNPSGAASLVRQLSAEE